MCLVLLNFFFSCKIQWYALQNEILKKGKKPNEEEYTSLTQENKKVDYHDAIWKYQNQNEASQTSESTNTTVNLSTPLNRNLPVNLAIMGTVAMTPTLKHWKRYLIKEKRKKEKHQKCGKEAMKTDSLLAACSSNIFEVQTATSEFEKNSSEGKLEEVTDTPVSTQQKTCNIWKSRVL